MQAMVDERAANGPYRDMTHFAERLESRQINKRQLENLAAAGAFDSMTANRRQAFEAVETVMRHASAAHAERESKQDNLFGGAGSDVAIRLKLPDVEDWPQEEKLRREFEALGFYLSAHPLQSYAALCQTLGVTQWSEIAAGTVAENRVKLAGIVIGRRLTTSSRGSRMAFVRMSDASGSFELTLFSEVLATARELLDDGKPLLVTVDVQRRDEGVRLTAQKVELLEEVAATASAGLRIFVADEAPLETLAAVIREHGAKGRGRISLVLAADEREVEVELATGYTISPGIRGAIKAIPGIVDVQDL
jgi:DNA polymerase-3 subunit alpha